MMDMENMTPEWRRRRGGGEDEEVEKMRRWRRQGDGEHGDGVESAPVFRNRLRA